MCKWWHLVDTHCNHTKFSCIAWSLKLQRTSPTSVIFSITYFIIRFGNSGIWLLAALSWSFLGARDWRAATVLETSRRLHRRNIYCTLPGIVVWSLAIRSGLFFIEILRPLSAAGPQQSQEGRRAHAPGRSHALRLYVNSAKGAETPLGGRVVQQSVLGAPLCHAVCRYATDVHRKPEIPVIAG